MYVFATYNMLPISSSYNKYPAFTIEMCLKESSLLWTISQRQQPENERTTRFFTTDEALISRYLHVPTIV